MSAHLFLAQFSIGAVRVWTRLYTMGMLPHLRDGRLAELESDLWECRHDATDDPLDGLAIIGRLFRGVPDDLRWRTEHMVHLSRSAAWAIASALGIAIVVTSVWLGLATRAMTMPPPPAPPNLLAKRVNYPPPPPPPPPPCNPPGIGRAPFSPCTPYR
jgi:hypothetical protein